MPLPKLTALQSRLGASLAASVILVLLYLTLAQPQFAYAVELDSRIPPDHNHPLGLSFDPEIENENEGSTWIPEIGALRGRALTGVSTLANNAPQKMNIEAGVTISDRKSTRL